MLPFVRRAVLIGALTSVQLLPQFALSVAAETDTFEDACIVDQSPPYPAKPDLLIIKTRHSGLVKIDSSGYANRDGNNLSRDQCYRFRLVRAEDDRLVLESLDREEDN